MARQARAQSEFQHVIIRGIGKQILFEDDADRVYFISLMQRYRDESDMIILAYCLMENHVHLLLRDKDGKTALFMKRIGISYAGYYNRKYDRTGHLFQDRYKSENILDDRYLLAVYRYILRNPEKAGISAAKDYPWSSYSDFGKSDGLTDTSLQTELIGDYPNFLVYMAADDPDEYMEDTPNRHDDAWAQSVIKQKLNVTSGTALQQMPKAQRDEALALLKRNGISVRQLERLTGINRGIIQKA